jgi:hypothetical protein
MSFLRRRKRTVMVLLLSLILGVVVPLLLCRGRGRAHTHHHGKQAPAVVAETPSTPPIDPAMLVPCSSYEEYLDRTRLLCRTPLDVPPGDWSKPEKTLEFADPGRFTFGTQDLPSDFAGEELDRARKEDTLVRRLPYPFSMSLAVPSDCCGSNSRDVFYSSWLMARQYGLDLTSSFFPFSATGRTAASGAALAMFTDEGTAPVLCPVPMEGGSVDAFPLLLTYYYRGWIDHAHGWSNESGCGYSAMVPCTAQVSDSGSMAIALEPTAGFSSNWIGLALELDVENTIASFEITLTDLRGQPHSIVYGVPLGERQGWDISGLSRTQLRRFLLKLSDEKNRRYLTSFGKRQGGGPLFASGSLTFQGEQGAAFRLGRIQPYDIDSARIREQMARMQAVNVLPCVTTYHGGNTSWTNLHNGGTIAEEEMRADGRSRSWTVARPALGCSPSEPAFIPPLMAEFGIRTSLACLHPTGPGQGLSGQLSIQNYGGTSFYVFPTAVDGTQDSRFPEVSGRPAHAENLGVNIARYLQSKPTYGAAEALYFHQNYFNPEAFCPPTTGTRQMYQIKKLHPSVDAGLSLLANLKYNLDGKRPLRQRVWVVPVSVQMRFLQVRDQLRRNVAENANVVTITPWTDPVSGQVVPDPDFPSQDLHGQTFYVADAAHARIFVGEQEITSLKRNPPDQTGRPSVSVIDETTPRTVFDEVDFYEQNGQVVPQKASSYLRQTGARSGSCCLEVQAESTGDCGVAWKPYRFDNFETDYVRFSYRKSNPRSRVVFGWSDGDDIRFVATEGSLQGRQGWHLPQRADTEYQDVVLDFADMEKPAQGEKAVPRTNVRTFYFGLQDASPGDAVFFDRVEFLSARGVRPHAGAGLVVGGQLQPPADGQEVTLTIAGKSRRTVTQRGGWYWFNAVAPGAVFEVASEKEGVRHFPIRGRLNQADRNDLEYHIGTDDCRNPCQPRPKDFIGRTISPSLAMKCSSSYENMQRTGSLYEPHSSWMYAGCPGNKWSYLVKDYVNNHGHLDRDRRFANPDGAIRILVQGECWTEGLQTPIHEHLNHVVESILRRRTGVPVEVLVTGSSSSSPASYSLAYAKYGNRFRPDLTFLFLNPFNMAHLEPTLLRKLIGWDKEHSPYQMYDFDARGNLLEFPPDPQYGAFTEKPDSSAIIGTVPLEQSFSVLEASPDLVQRGFDLLRAILIEKYQKPQAAYGGRLGLIYGYTKHSTPAYGTRQGSHTLAIEKWYQDVEQLGVELGMDNINLSSRILREDFERQMFWEYDSHMTATGQYKMAVALAESIWELPAFQDFVRSRKSQSTFQQPSDQP